MHARSLASERNLDTLPDLLTVKELAAWLSVSVNTVYDGNGRGPGPAPVKVGCHLRYPKKNVTNWVDTLQRHDWEGKAA